MNILLVNPNTSDLVLGYMMSSAKRAAQMDTEVVGMRSPGGTSSIDSSYGDYMSAPHMIEAVRQRVGSDKPDAVVLAGFGNVGIYALKEILDTGRFDAYREQAAELGIAHDFTRHIERMEQWIIEA